ncbi:Tripartite tricarboxylate transporter TctB family protein [Anaerovirgula multivorans]|uniref:Tripartite tricarboxylate transporter TctB family protein n=1 Tax=Anaerovirgula multivorans TaxID=312168 RepID=A0A239GQC1_9FIRM|nr:tripartite tricarboxylate transporter TctB family protein [Anaerovirgula multivorans]SNS70703.1 Tripartite tricarboxylate transporter TctB family protein [Anaerovirgula multivorans]
MSEKQKDILSSMIFLIIGVAVFAYSATIQTVIKADVGPAFAPKIVTMGIIILAVVKLGLSIKKNTPEYTKKSTKNENTLNGLLTIVALGLYVALFNVLGFIISSALYLFFQMYLLMSAEKRNYIIMGIISITVPVCIYFLFVKAFSLMLPAGLLG